MVKSLKFILAATLFLVGTWAIGQERGDASARFNEADTDGDGTLSTPEFKSYVVAKLPAFKQFDQLMEKLDVDQNGSISAEEFGRRRDAVKALMAQATAAPVEFADEFNLRFSKRKPLVGEPIGDLIALDENGDGFDFSSLKGKYTVINFGCLT